MWVGTDGTYFGTNEPNKYWVETGLTDGSACGSSTEVHFFWSDNRPNGGGYNCHPGGGASLGTNYAFKITWVGSGTWDVYEHGSYVGSSTSDPGCSYGLEAGVESADNSNSESGEDTNLQIQTTSGGSFTDGWPAGITVPSVIGPGMTFNWINEDHSFTTYQVPNGPPGNGPAAVPGLAGVKKIVLATARADGESHPTQVFVVRTTRQVAEQVAAGAAVNSDPPVYFVVLHGHFIDHSASIPSGAVPPTGTVLTLTINAATNQAMDFGIGNVSPRLNRMGVAEQLSLSPDSP